MHDIKYNKVMLYNVEQKMEYLKHLELINKDYLRVRSTFNKISEYEESMSKDVSLMNTEELINMFVEVIEQPHVPTERSYLIGYIEWCQVKGFCTINYLDKRLCPSSKIKDAYETKILMYYISPKKYDEYCELIKEDVNSKYYLGLFMAIYEGFTIEELLLLNQSDISNHSIRSPITGLQREVSQKLEEALIESSEVDTLYNLSRNTYLRYGISNDAVFKVSSKTKSPKDTLKRSLLASVGKIGNIVNDDKLSKDNLYRSGIFNYVLEESKRRGFDLKSDMKIKKHLNSKYQEIFHKRGLTINFNDFSVRFAYFVDYLD